MIIKKKKKKEKQTSKQKHHSLVQKLRQSMIKFCSHKIFLKCYLSFHEVVGGAEIKGIEAELVFIVNHPRF